MVAAAITRLGLLSSLNFRENITRNVGTHLLLQRGCCEHISEDSKTGQPPLVCLKVLSPDPKILKKKPRKCSERFNNIFLLSIRDPDPQ